MHSNSVDATTEPTAIFMFLLNGRKPTCA